MKRTFTELSNDFLFFCKNHHIFYLKNILTFQFFIPLWLATTTNCYNVITFYVIIRAVTRYNDN